MSTTHLERSGHIAVVAPRVRCTDSSEFVRLVDRVEEYVRWLKGERTAAESAEHAEIS